MITRDLDAEQQMNRVMAIVRRVRELRQQHEIPARRLLSMRLKTDLSERAIQLVEQMANVVIERA